jgi:hypothetical protein
MVSAFSAVVLLSACSADNNQTAMPTASQTSGACPTWHIASTTLAGESHPGQLLIELASAGKFPSDMLLVVELLDATARPTFRINVTPSADGRIDIDLTSQTAGSPELQSAIAQSKSVHVAWLNADRCQDDEATGSVVHSE